uniref:Uncharacterized protein n=1 Tax=Daucus carota subsp. sativus TaxID=79200 RepID=A0A162BAH1_DAUCS
MSGHEDDERYSRRQAKRLRRFSFYTAEEEAEERLHGFVSERELQKGDEIGLFWCNYSHCFFFSVLARAPAQPSV